jgi:hypothetical protein
MVDNGGEIGAKKLLFFDFVRICKLSVANLAIEFRRGRVPVKVPRPVCAALNQRPLDLVSLLIVVF